MFEQVKERIEASPHIILHRHQNPDGDALGSQLGLALVLRDAYPDKLIHVVGDMTPRFAFMAQTPMDTLSDEDFDDALCILLDMSSAALVSDTRYRRARDTVRLDHHVYLEKFADLEVTDSSYESCCGLVTAMIMECGWELSPAAAKLLYTGMITDSGRFRYASTSARTFRLAAFLMEREFDTTDIYRSLYADDLFFIQLRARMTLKIQTTPHRVAYIYTTKEEADSFGTDTFTLSRGMVNVMSEIRGIDIWVNFTESDEGVYCEIRSSRHNINPVAVKYGGGGHQRASGATLKDREEAMRLLSDLFALTEADV